ncbi:glycosyltransferase [Leuconostoc mesenteroides]|uniref:Glycosyltransferase, group 1 family protein n=1 Tax=Leuconostoc mesenteroides subsp. cremoris ATCC 19254 TaxID=586220 RepID=C2KHE9_LEUMC|nr:glycosyltransferase [Leuconostoc mesenteroides]EEJ43357.1 glycosyltransferase, group 1 family protein [Leuconostoc mesenteroides subsp. cremoris ATCC 19254]MDG9751018.1 glycosyltransferase [Leuconostoc mesenteroides]
MKIKFVSTVRGFLSHLLEIESDIIKFDLKKDTYEVSSTLHALISKCIRASVGDHLGIIQSIKSDEKNRELILGSFNRFLNTKQNYFIYVENPTALYHYSLNRPYTYLGNRRFSYLLSDHHLKYMIFMSKAALYSSDNVWGREVPISKEVIYPLIPKNPFAEPKQKDPIMKLKLLYVAQGSRFISKGGPEVIEMAIELGSKISLTIITNLDAVPEKLANKIYRQNNIQLQEFNKSFLEMEKIYAFHDILIYPTSDDSYALTVLEAIKAGMVVIGSNMYAIPEMVADGKNGFLTNPKWQFFDKNNIPNPQVWNHRKSTIFSMEPDKNIVNFLVSKVCLLNSNRKLLYNMSLESILKANSEPFDEVTITGQWEKLAKNIN